MVRKVISIMVAIITLACCFATASYAATYEVYENPSMSSTYITYFKDIISNQSITSDYVAFRSGQYKYTLAVGDLIYDGEFNGDGIVKIYEFDTQTITGYNSYLDYSVYTDNSFYLYPSNKVVYSNLGDYPTMIERGANFEVLQTILLCVLMLSVVINRIFFYSKRR